MPRQPSLPLTKETLEQAYEYLRTTPPFRNWNMPEPEDVGFRVVRSVDTRGWYRQVRGRHVIGVSSRCIGRTSTLMAVMAHEMVHLHQGDVKMDRPGVEHNAAFNKLAERVCRVHGFDPKLF